MRAPLYETYVYKADLESFSDNCTALNFRHVNDQMGHSFLLYVINDLR